MPQLRSCTLYHVAIPLKRKIKHASHERSVSDSMVVRVELSDGSVGFGEGVPRSYVTGETIPSTFEVLSRVDLNSVVGNPGTPAEFVRRLSAWTVAETQADPRGMSGNAARCAIELALFDAFGHAFRLSVGEILRQFGEAAAILSPSPQPVRYSGAITAETMRKERVSAWKMRLYGFYQVKIKVGVQDQDDPARLSVLRSILGKKVDIRVDANEAWSSDEVVQKTRPLLPFQLSALEQPVPHAQVGALSELRDQIGVPIMLDESLCGLPDARTAIQNRTADLFNVRLSKCGGFLNGLRIAMLAREAGLGVQLGCHPGETGLLSAAGRHFASNVIGLRYVEGSYDRHVLARNLTTPDITFRYGGWAATLTRPGLGVAVDPEALALMTVSRKDLEI